MKVRLYIDLELPENCKELNKGELQQLLFDEYVNHATCSHFEAATRWLAETGPNGRFSTDQLKKSAEDISEMHTTWGKICSKAKFDFEIREEKGYTLTEFR